MSAGTPASGRLVVDLPPERRGQRLDRALAALLEGQSRAAIQRLLREGRISVSGEPGRAAYRVRGGERVSVDLPPPRPAAALPEELPLAILHEDADLLVLNKPAGMAVHPGAGRRGGTLVNALLHHCRDLSGIGGVERPGIVHRLDRDTTGVLVVAKNDAAHRSLAAQFKARTVRKIYEALVWGRPRAATGAIDLPIGRHPHQRLRMAARPGGREAVTRYRVRAALGPVALVELEPRTGRTHQLRVHLAALGHPIVGDAVYGGRRAAPPRPPAQRAALAGYRGLALHARSLGFTHPRTGAWCSFESPRPPELEALIDALGGTGPAAGARAREAS